MIHTVLGFLLENSKFVKMCKQCNIKFIGPEHDTIDLMRNKVKAIKIMKASYVLVVPGYEGEI